jgi:hypothetical protein
MTSLILIEPMIDEVHLPDNCRAYFIESTASTSVDGDIKAEKQKSAPVRTPPSESIQKIVDYIVAQRKTEKNVGIELVVQIHGYNTNTGKSKDKYKKECRKSFDKIIDIQESGQYSKNIVIFLGYIWPSEGIIFRNISDALKALPLWLTVLSFVGLAWTLGHKAIESLVELFLNKLTDPSLGQLLGFSWNTLQLLLWFSSSVLAFTSVLLMLRSSAYFRDAYRATNYGVPDLVQFFRAFEYLLLKSGWKFQNKDRIRLSFIGHSMGGFVTSNLVRILSDVFDETEDGESGIISNSGEQLLSIIDSTNAIVKSTQKRSNIGKYFTLERLILVSPDIPVNTILSGRSNFLTSSLSRFKHSFLFSNEGDMVLLLLSTVANYISFPSTCSQMGYKLGNIGVDNDSNSAVSDFSKIEDEDSVNHVGNVLRSLVIGIEHENLREIGNDNPFIAQEFTYFDCTNYLRSQLSILNPNSSIEDYRQLNLLNYFFLLPKLGLTHGGYFKFPKTEEAIYTIACKGLEDFQKSTTWNEFVDGKHGIKVLKPEQ